MFIRMTRICIPSRVNMNVLTEDTAYNSTSRMSQNKKVSNLNNSQLVSIEKFNTGLFEGTLSQKETLDTITRKTYYLRNIR